MYSCTAKSRETLFPKKLIPLYLEDLKFWLWDVAGVTKIYLHYTFKQARFKGEFVLMKHKSGQNAKKSIKKDFFKLTNNANFRYDFRNSANNRKFKPIIDDINEIT